MRPQSNHEIHSHLTTKTILYNSLNNAMHASLGIEPSVCARLILRRFQIVEHLL